MNIVYILDVCITIQETNFPTVRKWGNPQNCIFQSLRLKKYTLSCLRLDILISSLKNNMRVRRSHTLSKQTYLLHKESQTNSPYDHIYSTRDYKTRYQDIHQMTHNLNHVISLNCRKKQRK